VEHAGRISWTLVAGLRGYLVGPRIAHALRLAHAVIPAVIVAIAGFVITGVIHRRQRDAA
jgi:membrane protein DedA with SNARE-associated domain